MKKIIVFLMILAISVSPLFRGLFFYYETTVFLTVIALLSFVYFMLKVKDREPVYYNKWLFLFGLLLAAAYVLAFMTAVNPRENLASLLLVLEYLLMSIVLHDYFHDKKEVYGSIILVPVIITGFINSVIGIEAITGAYKFLNVTVNKRRLGATFQYANTAAIYFAIIIIFSLTLMCALDKPFFRIILTGASNVIFLAMLLTRSRGGYIAGFFAIIVLMMIQARGYKLRMAGSFICAVIPALLLVRDISNLTASEDALSLNKLLVISIAGTLILALAYEGLLIIISNIRIKTTLPKPLGRALPCIAAVILIVAVLLLRNQIIGLIPDSIIERFARMGLNDPNISIRLTFDKDALKLISKNRLLGTGGGSWQILYYSVQEYFYISRSVHNHFLEIFVESGILGFTSFIAVVALSVFYMISALMKSKEIGQRIYPAGFFAAFVALVIHSSIDFDLSYVSVGALFWVMVVMSLPSDKHIIEFRKSFMVITMIIVSSVSLLLNGVYAIAAHNANIGLNLKAKGDHAQASKYYEEAIRLDPSNSAYSFELARLYRSFADISQTAEKKEAWKKAALVMAGRSIESNPYLPETNRLLIKVYYDLNMPLEGIEYAEKLINYQPCYNANYELLAKGYLEAGKYYMEKGNAETAKEYLEKCLNIDPPEDSEDITALPELKLEALTLLEENNK